MAALNIQVVGGGPAGLYFAILMRQRGHRLRVYERNPQHNTFGWGVVFSGRTIESLREPDPITHQRITSALRTWEDVDVVHKGVLTSVSGNRFSGIARIRLLNILQERCQELGVELVFEQEMTKIDRSADYVVCADGVHSRFRGRYFQPEIAYGRNRYIWYGTPQPFGGLTLIFKQDGPDVFAAHAYKYSDELSTFIVEMDEPTWQRLKHQGEPRLRERLQKLFGLELLSNRSRWIRFVNVKNRHWHRKNMVLLGDALHTAHFSIGSGTKLAMEDSIALWKAFEEPEPLAAFERDRRPVLEEYQQIAETSQRWFENVRDRLHLDVVPFVYECMTRSSRLDEERLARRDPAFVARYREWNSGRS